MDDFTTLFDKADPVGSTFAPLLGLPAWGVQKGQGSMLTFEFGAPYLLIREPVANPSTDNPKIRKMLQRRRIVVHGAWNLWVYICHWRCCDNGIQQCVDLSSDMEINEAARLMDGQQLVSVEVDASSGKSLFRFDLGATLETWPYGDEKNEEQWLLFTPSGNVLTYRADGHYCWGASNQSPHEEVWLPLPRLRA
jgi:hypothetical protein